MSKNYLHLILFVLCTLKLSSQSVQLSPIGSYATGIFDEGAAETLSYLPESKTVYFTNADDNSVGILNIDDPTNPILLKSIDLAPYGGGVNSVTAYGEMIAVAVEADIKQDNGKVVFFDSEGTYIADFEVGALPDMATFTQDGKYVLVANEGEPNDDYTVDPEGSVSVIDVQNGVQNATVKTATFEAFTDVEMFNTSGIRIFGPNATIAQDLEPEFIAEITDNNKAAIVCQENNAIAILDIATARIEAVLPLGFKDHSLSNNALDASDKDDSIAFRTHPILGMYQPDAIKYASIQGKGFLITANEGDSRDYDGYSEETRVKDLNLDQEAYPDFENLQQDEILGRLKTTTATGDIDGDGDIDQIYSYGARSFSIWDANTGALVFDSGSTFERKIAELYPDYFNANNDNNNFESRSDDKGPEPEAVEIIQDGRATYALIGLERMGGIMVYDISDPKAPVYVTYVNNRDFTQDVETKEAGDLGVEYILYIDAQDSPNGEALVITANEVSGTITIFDIDIKSRVKLFDEEITIDNFQPSEFVMPPTPLKTQVVFIGGHDIVQTTPTYGNPAGKAIAKEWNDFIGFTNDESDESIGWVTINHEQIYRDDRIGDGGGMTAFRIDKDTDGNIVVMDQTLSDGRTGQFFNVDFVNTVGETGMNCGGIVGPNGRIWTAEEWFRSSTSSILGSSARTSSLPYRVAGMSSGWGVRDTALFTINAEEFPEVNGMEIPKFQNFNYMTEVDPKEAKAIRKQYNWGRAGWEGGAISNDGKYVYLGIDGSPAPWVRFTADVPFDFTNGTMEVYKQDNPQGQRWIAVDMDTENTFGGLTNSAWELGATMFMRNEWVTIDRNTGMIYWTETGRDGSSGAGVRFTNANTAYNVIPAAHHEVRAQQRGQTTAISPEYQDYYGSVLYYDPSTEEVGVAIEGGPYFQDADGPTLENYPSKHLSNPDGLSMITIDNHEFLMIQEDLNGRSYGRVPAGESNSLCELYLLDVDAAKNASINDLIRVTAVPKGAEITGAIQIDDNTILVNAQHPNPENPFPFNHSVTLAIHGFADVTVDGLIGNQTPEQSSFYKNINNITREVTFYHRDDFAVYNEDGKRVKVVRDTEVLSFAELAKGDYTIINSQNESAKLSVF